MRAKHFNVVVVGAGSAGISAAVSAARNGARTALIESGPMLGGELLSGMTIDGAINANGEAIVGGVLDELVRNCRELGGFIEPLNDFRLIQYIAYDPEIMKIAVAQLVYDAGVTVMLNTIADEVVREDDRIRAVVIRDKSGRTQLTADAFVDASGDADLCALADCPMLPHEGTGHPQPVSMMFRMSGVANAPLLDFVQTHPEYFALGESAAIRGGRTDRELAEAIHRQGQPCVFLKGDAPFLGGAIARGEMFPTALIMIQPTSAARREVCVNATRVSLRDPLDPGAMSTAFRTLVGQIQQCAAFLKAQVPGFEDATISGIAPRIGIRETRRIRGDHVLSTEEVMAGHKSPEGIAKGCHHIDVHQDGTGQIRIPVADGGSYDIPYGSLLPQGVSNVVAAGRCLSATRDAHGSARVMGGCLAMGQAAGTAAALAMQQNAPADVRAIGIGRLRDRLKQQGAVLGGTA